MMNNYPIGTTLDIKLNFWKKGNAEGSLSVGDIPCDISGYKRSVFFKTSKGVINIDDSVCDGSTLSWSYAGNAQRITGVYTIVVILYNGDGSELIHQEFEGFGLLMPSYCHHPSQDRTIVRDAWIELYEFHPVVPEMSVRTENWVIDGVDTGKAARGNGWAVGTALTPSRLTISATHNSLINTYGHVLKIGDIYYNPNTADVFMCTGVTIAQSTQTSTWKFIANIKGREFRYSDFTSAELNELKRPATEAAAVANTAAGAANAAASNANAKADLANRAASAANEKAGAAQSAANTADEAAAAANTAATNAQSKANEAGTAAGVANAAAQSAQRAASDANAAATTTNAATANLASVVNDAKNATSNANLAAGRADDSASHANRAAARAADATSSAEAAATSANNAAGFASTAAAAANTAKTGADTAAAAANEAVANIGSLTDKRILKVYDTGDGFDDYGLELEDIKDVAIIRFNFVDTVIIPNGSNTGWLIYNDGEWLKSGSIDGLITGSFDILINRLLQDAQALSSGSGLPDDLPVVLIGEEGTEEAEPMDFEVLITAPQTLTDAQKAQVKQNLGITGTGGGSGVPLVDNLTSTSTTSALTANQGKVLKDLVDGKQAAINASNKLPYSYISGTPAIPAAVTESTVSGWGFTKNAGTYSKPSGGIPKSDLDSTVRDTLDKVDALYEDYSAALNLI